jgi:hypothetical protein
MSVIPRPQKHEELLEILQQAEKEAGDLCGQGCALRTVVSGLRDLIAQVKDRIREYKNPPLET